MVYCFRLLFFNSWWGRAFYLFLCVCWRTSAPTNPSPSPPQRDKLPTLGSVLSTRGRLLLWRPISESLNRGEELAGCKVSARSCAAGKWTSRQPLWSRLLRCMRPACWGSLRLQTGGWAGGMAASEEEEPLTRGFGPHTMTWFCSDLLPWVPWRLWFQKGRELGFSQCPGGVPSAHPVVSRGHFLLPVLTGVGGEQAHASIPAPGTPTQLPCAVRKPEGGREERNILILAFSVFDWDWFFGYFPTGLIASGALHSGVHSPALPGPVRFLSHSYLNTNEASWLSTYFPSF